MDTFGDNRPAGSGEVAFARPGIHRLRFNDGKELAIAVNLDPAESRTGPLSEEELIRIGGPLNADPSTVSRTLAAGIFLLESWLSGRAGRADAATA